MARDRRAADRELLRELAGCDLAVADELEELRGWLEAYWSERLGALQAAAEER